MVHFEQISDPLPVSFERIFQSIRRNETEREGSLMTSVGFVKATTTDFSRKSVTPNVYERIEVPTYSTSSPGFCVAQ